YQAYPSWVAKALYFAGTTYEKLNQKDRAKKVYREILDKFPTEKISSRAKERLAGM
ncbi:MAG TPA: tetratricopeptide repeat protein, partial [Caldithrix sp.]|nr:tetratricopeptide repeat protein [Caldithrix sp.]